MRRSIPILLLLLALAAPCGADTATLLAIQDSTIYENFSDSGNGKGEWFFTSVTNTGAIRRGLVQFDLSRIPPGSIIHSAALRLTLTKFGGSTPTVGLHPITQSWTSEDGRNSAGQEGSPDLALPGDVTWQFRIFPTLEWTNQGADFVATPSATLLIPGVLGTFTWASNPAMVSNVQGWVDAPATNFGWLLKVQSESGRRSRRWSSRASTANGPKLILDFTPLALFKDGFESGDTGAWSETSP